jgi:hypothetical protein
MKIIKGFEIDPNIFDIKEVDIPVSEAGSCFDYMYSFFDRDEWDSDIEQEKDGLNHILYIKKNNLINIASQIEKYTEDKLKKLSEEEQQAEQEIINSKKLRKHDIDINGFLWKGQLPKDMIFDKALLIGIDFFNDPVSTNITLEEIKKIIEFRKFNGTEILYKQKSNFNLLSF